jgi:hypothetical protein
MQERIGLRCQYGGLTNEHIKAVGDKTKLAI